MLTVDLERLKLGAARRALDLGCGRGRHAHALYTRGGLHVFGLDLSFEDVAATKAGFAPFVDAPAPESTVTLAVGDALRLPYSDGFFEAVICSEVLEHIPDYRAALAEIARVCAPGARFAATVPRAWPEWLCWRLAPQYPNSPGGHVRIFDAVDLRADIIENGFDYTGKSYAHGLHSPYWWLRCANWERQEEDFLVRQYRKFLEWDIMKRPLLTRMLEKIADPVMGKSVALYFERRA